ncbi:hypothetical protein GWK47_004037 [Chionoecetes opilio]|uniref:Uncharacterized protein n=1 Tax=Chionoecetes opilio TaxID=41210 RepID=A0A8J4YHC5_CHIOP|nr:hypothetical protein GWK47_004037 [Chionoecetes opilio]
MSFTPRHPTPAAETGPVSSSNRKWERPAAFLPVVNHILELVVHAVFVRVLGCSSSPEHLLFKRFQNPMGSIDREGFGTGIMVEEVATVLEESRMRLFDGLFKSFKSVRTFAMTTGNWSNLSSFFLGGPLPVEFDSLLLEQCTRPMDVKSPLLLQDLDVPGPVPLDEEGERGLQRLCLFVVRVYAKGPGLRLLSRFKPLDSTSNSSRPSAPKDKIDPEIGDVALSKLSSHLWYCQKNWLGCPSSTSDVSCETQKRHG